MWPKGYYRGIACMKKNNTNGLNIIERIKSLIDNLSEEKQEQLLELLLEWQQTEQRNDERIPCLIAVSYADQKRVYHDFIQDLSKGGMFIETREPLTVGEKISLTFAMPEGQSHFKISGKIIRSAKEGVGVQFENKLSKYQEEIIRKLVGNDLNY